MNKINGQKTATLAPSIVERSNAVCKYDGYVAIQRVCVIMWPHTYA